ncbi:MAG: c-type cytochrome biogenesis protein CcmI [Acetobacteraceae bacterium]
MTIALYIILTLLCLSPLLLGLLKRQRRETVPSTTDSEQAFYAAQLDALEEEKRARHLNDVEARDMQMEIARRLLRAKTTERAPSQPVSWRVIAAISLLLPTFGTALYLYKGEPGYGPQSASTPQSEIDPQMRPVIARLEKQVAVIQPDDPAYIKLHLLLAAVREKQNRLLEALALYRAALHVQFEALLAIHVADLQSQLDNRIDEQSLRLYERALDAAPKDAPWRLEVQKRIAQGEHDTQPAP